MELHELREQKPKANCVEAEGPEMELREQREQTHVATCVHVSCPTSNHNTFNPPEGW